MKNTKLKMARKSLLEQAFEQADAIIGIATALPIFRLVHLLNQHSRLKLECEDDIPIYIDKVKLLLEFPFYIHEDEDLRTSFFLVSNSNKTALILPSHKQLSYLLILKGAIPNDKISSLVISIKQIPGIQLATLLNQSTLKNFESVMEDLELHLDSIRKKKSANSIRIMPSAENQ